MASRRAMQVAAQLRSRSALLLSCHDTLRTG